MSKMKIGSLFAGIGGFDLGLERTGGFETAWFCEQAEFPTKILNQWWPGVPVYPDVTELKGDEVEPIDILTGGFPCQDISSAGKGAGIEGSRSGLWFEFARLIGELRPRYVLAENSPLLKTRGLNAVLGSLAEIGYDAEWDCVPARTFGAPHQRDRIWIVAYPSGEGPQGRGLSGFPGAEDPAARDSGSDRGASRTDGDAANPDGSPAGLEEHRGSGQEREPAGTRKPEMVRQGDRAGSAERHQARSGAGSLADAHDEGAGRRIELSESSESPEQVADAYSVRRLRWAGDVGEKGRRELTDSGSELGKGWPAEPDLPRVAYGLPDRVDRTKALGNALVPDIPEWIGRRILEWEYCYERRHNS